MYPTEFVRDVIPEIESRAPPSRPTDDIKRRLFDNAPNDGDGTEHYRDCVVSGPANPMGIAISCHREGDDAVAKVCSSRCRRVALGILETADIICCMTPDQNRRRLRVGVIGAGMAGILAVIKLREAGIADVT